MSKKTHRELFEEYCRDSYLEKTGKSGNTSKTICLDKANIIKDILKGEEVHESCSPSFVFWVKKTKIFQLQSLDELDLKDVLCLPAKVKNDNDKTIFSQYRIVAITEKFYDILERIHSTENGNVGYKKTLAEVHKSYECLPRAAVQQFCNTCPICQQKQPQTTMPRSSQSWPPGSLLAARLISLT